jgi:hypothetical protein
MLAKRETHRSAPVLDVKHLYVIVVPLQPIASANLTDINGKWSPFDTYVDGVAQQLFCPRRAVQAHGLGAFL